jgi:type IV pilus assembly protein PilW
MTPLHNRQLGLTLVELMIALTLGLFVAGAASALFLSTKSTYVAQDEEARIVDSGRYAIENVTRALRQASYEEWGTVTSPIVNTPSMSGNLRGLDAHSLKSNTPDIQAPLSKAVNGSDVLAIRFFGAGAGPHGDGSVVNCAGFGVGAPADQQSAEEDRGWSIYYVAESSSGEPELYCKYRGESGWGAQAIVQGVESFQVLYGLDSDGDGRVNRFVRADEINALDNTLLLNGATAAEQAADKNRKTNWKKVVVVQIAMLIRGAQNAKDAKGGIEYHLFGADYSAIRAGSDPGTVIKEASLPSNIQRRARKVFAATIQLRNHMTGSVE